MRVLILGGTTEASALARALEGDALIRPVMSFAGRTKAPVLPNIPCRVGGFGGVAGLVLYLREQGFEAVVDVTHPFAAQMTRHAVQACAEAGVALLRLDRPGWTAQEGDRWTMVADMDAAAAAIGGAPRRVLLTIGQQDLRPFTRHRHHYVVRSVDAPAEASLPAGASVITARGPFAVADECRLLVEREIEVLVTKNSGGLATAAKLEAARGLGLRVIMVERPLSPGCDTVDDVAGVLAWLGHHAALRRGA